MLIQNHEPFIANELLAHVMVDEITHVLQRIDRHSNEGVMNAVWSEQDYAIMKRHALPFAPKDIESIRTGLKIRSPPHARNANCRFILRPIPAGVPRIFPALRIVLEDEGDLR